MKILCEDTLTYGKEFFSDVGHVTFFSGSTLQPEQLIDVDCLLVRSTTRVDEQLLVKANCLKFVATATAGTDHVDIPLLESRDIEFFSAAGCNAIAVAEYVIAALMHLSEEKFFLENKSVGIVGAGNVGTVLAQKLDRLGVCVKLYDPPLQDAGDGREFVTLEQIMKCDVISLHVPLVEDGLYPTRKLIDAGMLEKLNNEQTLVNACRGEVIDQDALLELKRDGRNFKTVLDVWESEPNIDFSLVPFVDIATQHIAGHTIEGKARGTDMVYQRLINKFDIEQKRDMWQFLPQVNTIEIRGDDKFSLQKQLVASIYDITQDDKHFREQVIDGASFRYSRKNYGIRREFGASKVCAGNFQQSQALYELGIIPINKN
ncbi:MAG: DUF3410 domain-containing protein [Alteromonadaceae bacterium]|nr:DUF3410 domain-containing protein [Alteromonadaceae bacterium]